MKNFAMIMAAVVFLVCSTGTQAVEMITVFSDDYDAVWDATPVPASMLGSVYIGVPSVSGSVARGIGSGYSHPLYTWMVSP